MKCLRPQNVTGSVHVPSTFRTYTLPIKCTELQQQHYVSNSLFWHLLTSFMIDLCGYGGLVFIVPVWCSGIWFLGLFVTSWIGPNPEFQLMAKANATSSFREMLLKAIYLWKKKINWLLYIEHSTDTEFNMHFFKLQCITI